MEWEKKFTFLEKLERVDGKIMNFVKIKRTKVKIFLPRLLRDSQAVELLLLKIIKNEKILDF